MSATVSSLPPEILLNILSSLNPFDLENVVRTFNRHLYNAAITLLGPLRWWIQNSRRMCALFPPNRARGVIPAFPGHIDPFLGGWHNQDTKVRGVAAKRVGLDPEAGPYVLTGPPDLLWMRLDGSLDWLQPLDKSTADQMRPHTGVEGDRPPSPRFEAIAQEAEKLGLTLPPGFRKFFASDRLHHRVASSHAWWFDLSDLIKCPPSIDNGAGGYLLRFHFDQQYCAFAYLYMNTRGNHCVLYSGTDVYESLEEGGEEGGEGLVNEEFAIAGLTFEEYLVCVYFEGLLYFQKVPSDGLREYVAHVYRPVTRSKKGTKR